MEKIKSKIKPIIIITVSVIVLISGIFVYLFRINYFNILEIIVSPNNTTIITVYEDTSAELVRDASGNKIMSKFYYDVKGDLNFDNYGLYTYNGVYISPCHENVVLSTIDDNGRIILEVVYSLNDVHYDLTNSIRQSIISSKKIKELSYALDYNIQVDVIKWTDVKDVMTVEFEYINSEDKKTAGTLDYNCVTEMITNIDYETEVESDDE